MVVTIDDPTKVGEARRRASALAAELGFDETRPGPGGPGGHGGGEQPDQARGRRRADRPGARIGSGRRAGWRSWRWTAGPGMSDVGRCLADGYSTAGSLGTGLGAIARLSDDYAIYSQPGGGTAVWARLDAKPETASRRGDGGPGLAASACRSPGEVECGDDWAMIRSGRAEPRPGRRRAGARPRGGRGGRGGGGRLPAPVRPPNPSI